MRGERSRVTLADVAARAGVSRSTASLVMQDSDLVAAATRQAVLDAVTELGYVYHRGAASLRTHRSHSVGLVVTDVINPFFAELTKAIEAELQGVGEVALAGNTFDELPRQGALLTTLLEYQADGVLLVPAIGTRDDDIAMLVTRGIPHVLLTRYIGSPAVNYVGAEDVTGGRMGAVHLLEHGCPTVAYFGGPQAATARRDRMEGFRAAVAESPARSTPAWCVPTPTSAHGSYEVAAGLLATAGPPPAGVMCHSDAIAFGLMRALREAGLRPPRDVCVIGFDDVEAASVWEPPLTTVSVHAGEMGRAAATLLRRRMSGQRYDGPYLFPPELVIRESCGCRP